ncbi:juvenile hormone acid O-methyltransferase-like [Bradysia coprophila]|uniref:juvenile hormone acid O-methyltransferase-like n=1 Tax=Bradysia coprophila TaxID=38358 RepID=UPI00187D8C00|nr:juvenile hormone acid O-methyltransferase-like [Bradysia coprophila]
MDNPNIYENLNNQMRAKIKKILNEHRFHWRANGTDSLLDIGFGPGDITVDTLLPLLPHNFERLVGVDISNEMVKHARRKYSCARVSFHQLDIGKKIDDQAFNGIAPFDHITSFYCLHYVKNLSVAFENMHKLLKTGGDILILHIAQAVSFRIYKRLSQKDQWKKYMFDLDSNVPAADDVDQQIIEFKNMFRRIGFSHCRIDATNETYTFDNKVLFKRKKFIILLPSVAYYGTIFFPEFYKSVNPFTHRMSAEDQNAFIEDFYLEALDFGLALDDANHPACRMSNRHVDFVIYLKN